MPDNLVGQRFAGKKEHFFLLGEIRQRQANVREKGSRQHIDFFSGQQFLCGSDSIAGTGVIVASHQLNLLSKQSARGINLVNGQLHAFFIWLEKRWLSLVAIDLTNLEHALGMQ